MLAGNFMLDTRTCVLYNVNRTEVRKNKKEDKWVKKFESFVDLGAIHMRV